MVGFFRLNFSNIRRRSARPTQTVGSSGTGIFSGYLETLEKDLTLVGRSRYRTFSQILANTTIVAAGIRYFLNLTAKAQWTFKPSDADTDGEMAKLAERMLTKDPDTSWARIVRRAAMYRFYGFSVQEWTARRDDDGNLTFLDIAPRAQITIDRWDLDEQTGRVQGVVQKDPHFSTDIYIPRTKIVYMVDDSLSDSPEGLGLFRHLVRPSRQLERFEQLEGFGFENDLRGIPILRAPLAELARQLNDKEITEEEYRSSLQPLNNFMEKHVVNPKLSLLLDSATYETTDDAQRPSNQKLFDIDLLQGTANSLSEIADSIERKNREIARVIGVEGLLLGSQGNGSRALGKDKSENLYLTIDSTLNELKEVFEKDLLGRIWEINGFDPELMPTMEIESVQYKDVEQVATVLRDIAAAGAPLMPNDPAINETRAMAGLSPIDPNAVALDLSLNNSTTEAEDVLPENPSEDDE